MVAEVEAATPLAAQRVLPYPVSSSVVSPTNHQMYLPRLEVVHPVK